MQGRPISSSPVAAAAFRAALSAAARRRDNCIEGPGNEKMDMNVGRQGGRVGAVPVLLLLLMLLTMRGMVETAEGCSLVQLVTCLPASRSGAMKPSLTCCNHLRTLNARAHGMSRMTCLCSLFTSDAARLQGVKPRVALGIPRKCRLPVPRGYMCNGTLLQSLINLSLCSTFLSFSRNGE